MPAEIDTGGPRVLHCDYRADCPIPIVGSASSAPECSSHRSHRQTTATFLRRASDITREAPGSERRASCTSSSESLAGSYRHRVSPSVRARLRPPRRRASSESRSSQLEDAGRCFGAESSVSEGESRVDEGDGVARTISETEARVAGVRESWLREDACSRRSCPEARLPVGWSLLSSHRSRAPSVDRSPGQLSSLSLEASCIEQQSRRRTRSRTQSCPSETGDQPLDYSRDQTHSSCGSRKLRRVCPKSRSYFQLALLLFLVAFGQSGLLKSGVLHHSAKASTTGLSVLAIGTVIGAVSGAPIDLIGDAGVRAERSANLSHITGASRKIQMYIKNRHLQILPDGSVNGSNDDTSDYTIFQRTSVSRGQLRIQGVATCLYLCMDSCGLLYGSREYTEDCVFNETLEQHNYNTYSSVRWSTAKKTLYLGLNRRGQPRRVQVKGHNLGRLSAYARVLTQVAPPDRVEALQRRMLGAQHAVRHRHNARGGQHHHRGDVIQQSLCPSLPAQEKDGRDRFRCRKRKKRKKRKRRCRPDEKPGPQCQLPEERADSGELLTTNFPLVDEEGSAEWKRSCEGAAASEEACRHEPTSEPSATTLHPEEELPSPAEAASGGNATRNGKSKAPTSGAKKVGLAGSMSQSKKPNLTDGKKRKRKGTAPARRNNQPPAQGRKRLGPGTTSSRSAPDMATTAQPFTMSSSPSLPPGASTGPPAGRGASPRRRKLPTSPRNGFDRANSPPHHRRLGKTLFKPKNQRRLDNPAEGEVPAASAVTVPYQYSREPSSTALVPETSSVFDRSESSTPGILVDDSRAPEVLPSVEPSETSSPDEEPTSTTSGDYLTSTPDSKSEGASVGATSAPEIFRLLKDDRSVEDASEDADENEDDARFSSTETAIHPSTASFPIERLAM